MDRANLGSIRALALAATVAVACGSSATSGSGTDDPPSTLETPATGTSLAEPGRGKLFLCPRNLPALTRPDTPWVEGGSVVIAKVPFVEGSVRWESELVVTETETHRILRGNGLPNHPTGTFPVEPGTGAYPYYASLPAMGYENASQIPIAAYEIDLALPKNPVPNDEPTCIPYVFIGLVTQTGAAWHADVAFDSENNLLDPVSALPMDSCWGHPYEKQYHYHGYSWRCFPNQGEPGRHSPLFGYAIDGFGVFGPRGENGTPVTNDDLDECHGHTHEIEWDGRRRVMYHYHVNDEYPYTIGCYRGSPIPLPHHLQHLAHRAIAAFGD